MQQGPNTVPSQTNDGGFMSRFETGIGLGLSLLLLMSAGVGKAATLSVNCAAKEGLHSIGAALKVLQNGEGHSSSTINVSGACHENVVIQSLDRVTLTAVNGASVTDASGGTLDVINIEDSRDVAINGFTINAGSGNGINGITCGDFSLCRLSGNLIQGATLGAGFGVFGGAEASVDGDTFQNNGTGLQSNSGSKVRTGGQGRPITSKGNGSGIRAVRQGYVFLQATVENNSEVGVWVAFHSTVELSGSTISHNTPGLGVFVWESSSARFTGGTSITNNAGSGVVIQDLSMVLFDTTTVTGNAPGADVVCADKFPATRGVGDTGGLTNCVEPNNL